MMAKLKFLLTIFVFLSLNNAVFADEQEKSPFTDGLYEGAGKVIGEMGIRAIANTLSSDNVKNGSHNTSNAKQWNPSFDCNKASRNSEKIICSSQELSEIDIKLSEVYKNKLQYSSDKSWLKRQQNYWMKNTRDMCTNISCISDAYQARINELISEY